METVIILIIGALALFLIIKECFHEPAVPAVRCALQLRLFGLFMHIQHEPGIEATDSNQ